MQQIIFGLIIFTLSAASTYADDAKSSIAPVLSVIGKATIQVKPTRASLVVIVITSGDRLDTVQINHAERLARAKAVIDTLATSGRLRIDGLSYNLRRARGVTRGNPVDSEPFTASSVFGLELSDPASIGEIATALSRTGVVEVGSASYNVEDDRVAKRLAWVAAVEDAKGQADTIAQAAGVKLLEIIEISDPEVRPATTAYDMPTSSSISVIPPLTIPFYAQITMRWRIGR